MTGGATAGVVGGTVGAVLGLVVVVELEVVLVTAGDAAAVLVAGATVVEAPASAAA